jgi:hypothetical protein
MGSHQVARWNRPHVAMQNPAIVTYDKTPVTAHSAPVVETSRLANIGVNHRNVDPNSRSAIPPRVRMVNMAMPPTTPSVRRSVPTR